MNKHTPGPWVADEDDVSPIVCHAESREIIAFVFRETKDCVGNAILIAAAPEMLEALEAISPMLPRSLSTATWGDPAWTDALRKVEAAIAKAKAP
jgi:hypothetical protein